MIDTDSFRTHRRRLMIVLLAVAVLVVAALFVAIRAMSPMPPRTVTMATGPEGSDYHEFGKRYREILAREGIELRLLSTAGALENLARLRDTRSNVGVGLLQSGTTNGKESPGIASLGTVFYEPLWFFYRGEFRGKGIQNLRGRKIAIGPEGSGTRLLTLKLLERNGIDQRFADLLPLTAEEAGERLIRGEIDAAFMLTSWDDSILQRLLTSKGVELVSFPRTDAYIALYPFLSEVVLPEGAVDLAKNRPSSDVYLIAPKANLVVRRDLHPALQYLLLDAAEEVHSGPGMFQKAGQFPTPESIDLPLSDEARQFYRSGRPFLQRHLPFWLAALIGRLLFLLIPVAGVLYPLLRLFPSLYGWQMRRRIYRLYGELRFLEHDLDALDPGRSIDELNSRLDRIKEKANRMRVPAAYANMLYFFREHVTLVEGRLEKIRRPGNQGSGGPTGVLI
jgi:TRAP transporter TAXI family solute receptor